MPKLTEESRAGRRRRITEAALRCFARKGFAATSMADVSRESGMSSGSIYSHFASKDEILLSVAHQAFDYANNYFERAIKDDAAAYSPRKVCELTIDNVIPVEYATWMLGVWGEATVRDDLRQILEQAIVRARGILRATLEPWARARGEEDALELYADWIVAIAQSSIVRSVIERDASFREIAMRLAQTLPA